MKQLLLIMFVIIIVVTTTTFLSSCGTIGGTMTGLSSDLKTSGEWVGSWELAR